MNKWLIIAFHIGSLIHLSLCLKWEQTIKVWKHIINATNLKAIVCVIPFLTCILIHGSRLFMNDSHWIAKSLTDMGQRERSIQLLATKGYVMSHSATNLVFIDGE